MGEMSAEHCFKSLKLLVTATREPRKADLGGNQHPDRDAQLQVVKTDIAEESWLATGEPVIFHDTKKENVGNFKNNGSGEYRPVKDPRKVLTMIFPFPNWERYHLYGKRY